jgi:hypothetical protein
MTSPLHDALVQLWLELLVKARDSQQKKSKKKLSWRLGAGLESKCKDGTKSKYIADISIHGLYNNPRVIFEIAVTQPRKDALAKITVRLAKNPDLLGAVVISVLESPKYETPKRNATKRDALFMPSWVDAVKGSPEFGPITYRGFCWAGSVTCSLDIRLRGEDRPRAQQIVSLFYTHTYPTNLPFQQSIIPKSDSSDREASAAFTDLWRLLVNDVAGEGVVPVPFMVDWDMFRLTLSESLGPTAHWRFIDWNGDREVWTNELQAELERNQGVIV